MKKIVIFCFSIFIALSSFGQVIVKNSHNFSVEVKVGRKSFILPAQGRASTSLLSPNGENIYTVIWHENSQKSKTFTEHIGENLLIDVNREPEQRESSKTVPRVSSRSPVSRFNGELRVIKNASDRRFQVVSSDYGLDDLSLAPDQSSDSVYIPQGLMHLTLLVDLDADSVSTGRRYMQQVFTQIVAQDQKVIEITDNHLYVAFAGREKVVFVFHNTTEYDVVGVGGNVLGHVIASGKQSRRRLEANDGFMNATWQYIDNNNILRQAISIYVLAEKRMRVEIRTIK